MFKLIAAEKWVLSFGWLEEFVVQHEELCFVCKPVRAGMINEQRIVWEGSQVDCDL